MSRQTMHAVERMTMHVADEHARSAAAGRLAVRGRARVPGQIAAQAGFGVVAGGALETGEVSSHRQPQLISERHRVIGRDGRQAGEVIMTRHSACSTPPQARNVPGAA